MKAIKVDNVAKVVENTYHKSDKGETVRITGSTYNAGNSKKSDKEIKNIVQYANSHLDNVSVISFDKGKSNCLIMQLDFPAHVGRVCTTYVIFLKDTIKIEAGDDVVVPGDER